MTAASTATIPTQGKPPAILSLIGDTPLVEITRMDTGPCQLFVKLENQNPTGSIKDRVALAMIEAAERDGKLRPGGTIIEATAGNTGLGLALIAGAKGYRIILVIPDKMSQEKIAHVRALGAEVRMTRSDVTRGHPEYYQDVAARLAEEIPGAILRQSIRQSGQSARARTHDRSGDLGADAPRRGRRCRRGRFGRDDDRAGPIFFDASAPGIEMILADPTGSVLYEWVKTRRNGARPEAGRSKASARISSPKSPTCRSSPTRSRSMTRKVSRLRASCCARKEFSAAPLPARCLPAALRYCRAADGAETRRHFRLRHREQISLEDVQRFLDGGAGLRAPPAAGRSERFDLPSRPKQGEVISVGPNDTLLTAFKRMRRPMFRKFRCWMAAGAQSAFWTNPTCS